MKIKQFAIPLDEGSQQTGEITFKELRDNGTEVEFDLSNVEAGDGDKLNLITKTGDTTHNHFFDVVVEDGTAYATLSASQIATVFHDADGAKWDYVEAHWMLGTVDTPDASVTHQTQGGKSYNMNGWPPKT